MLHHARPFISPRMPPPSAVKTHVFFAVFITVAVALSCELGIWLLRESGRSISLIWPATGIGMAIFSRWGWRALPWVALGHTVLWLRFPMTWSMALVPFLLPLEAWLASYLGFRLPILRKPDRSAMDRTAWRLLLVPWLACLPCSAVIGWASTRTGMFPDQDLAMTIARIAMTHVHGMVALGPVAAHLLRQEYSLRPGHANIPGISAIVGALCMMTLAFTGFFNDVLGLSASAYLPFPLVIMVGVTCRPPMTAIFIAIWCLSTSVLTNLDVGPLDQQNGWGRALELGIYNLIICSTAYLVSVGSTRFMHQLRRNDLTLEAAGMEQWEWSSHAGLRAESRDRQSNQIRRCTVDLPPLQALALLTGTPVKDLFAIPDHWRQRIEPEDDSCKLLMSSGLILSRNREGIPQQAIGMLQDLSAIRKAEEALIALGHQRAQLRSLQTRLNPHFLFNALNATRALIHLDPKKASDAVTTLARLLRTNLRNTDKPLIPLADEIQLVTDLLNVSAMRFGDRLQTKISVDAIAEDALVPPMMLFNLVENALIHGIEKSSGTGMIALDAKVLDDDLVLSVSNPGKLTTPFSPGVGTKDAKQRLELIFGALGRFRLLQSSESTVLAEVVIPFRDYESAHC